MHLIGSVLYGADDAVRQFVQARLPHVETFGDSPAIGVVVNHRIIGGIVYTDYKKFNLFVNAAFDSPMWCRPDTLRHLFGYPFNQLGCVRITALTGKSNTRSRKTLESLGFKLEGASELLLDGRETACIYGMRRDKCRWIKGSEDGKIDSRRATAA